LAHIDTLAHTALHPLSPEHCEEQVRRVVQSATFRNATTLQQLLQFLATKTLSGSTEILKEYTIGVEALGRKADFDPKIDPIVRVQSHRLRLKLREYYEVEGSGDPILIQFPKGHYLPIFEPMSASTPSLGESVVEHDSSTHIDDERTLASPSSNTIPLRTSTTNGRWPTAKPRTKLLPMNNSLDAGTGKLSSWQSLPSLSRLSRTGSVAGTRRSN